MSFLTKVIHGQKQSGFLGHPVCFHVLVHALIMSCKSLYYSLLDWIGAPPISVITKRWFD